MYTPQRRVRAYIKFCKLIVAAAQICQTGKSFDAGKIAQRSVSFPAYIKFRNRLNPFKVFRRQQYRTAACQVPTALTAHRFDKVCIVDSMTDDNLALRRFAVVSRRCRDNGRAFRVCRYRAHTLADVVQRNNPFRFYASGYRLHRCVFRFDDYLDGHFSPAASAAAGGVSCTPLTAVDLQPAASASNTRGTALIHILGFYSKVRGKSYFVIYS